MAFGSGYILLCLVFLVKYGDFSFFKSGWIVKCRLHLGRVATVSGRAHHFGLLEQLGLQLLLHFNQRLRLHLEQFVADHLGHKVLELLILRNVRIVHCCHRFTIWCHTNSTHRLYSKGFT